LRRPASQTPLSRSGRLEKTAWPAIWIHLDNMIEFKPSKQYIGGLCHRGHRYRGTKRSRRYLSNRCCVDCANENSRNQPPSWTPEKKAAYDKEYRAKNIDSIRASDIEYNKKNKRRRFLNQKNARRGRILGNSEEWNIEKKQKHYQMII
jgi:hypothetical protein